MFNRNNAIWLGGFLHLEVFARKKTLKVELLGQKRIYILTYYDIYRHIKKHVLKEHQSGYRKHEVKDRKEQAAGKGFHIYVRTQKPANFRPKNIRNIIPQRYSMARPLHWKPGRA